MNARHVQGPRGIPAPQVEEMAAKRQQPAGEARAERKDQVVLSEKAQTFRKLKELAADAPEMRMEKVEALRAVIARGDYHVPAEEIAKKMLEGK